MATPNINNNQWYSLQVNRNNNASLLSTNNFSRDHSAGASFFTKTNHSDPRQRWQIYGINSTTFVLRTQEGGATLFLGSQGADKNGIISPLMLRGDVADASVFWQLGAWGDDTFYLWNGGNGTGYHLARTDTGIGICMNNSIAAPQNKQRWIFDGVAAIDDQAYSTVAVSLLLYDKEGAKKMELTDLASRRDGHRDGDSEFLTNDIIQRYFLPTRRHINLPIPGRPLHRRQNRPRRRAGYHSPDRSRSPWSFPSTETEPEARVTSRDGVRTVPRTAAGERRGCADLAKQTCRALQA